MLIHYYHLSPSEIKEIPMVRIWTLWGEIPEIQKVFWGDGKEGKKGITPSHISAAKKRGIKLPSKGMRIG